MYTVDNAVIMAAGAASRFAPLSYERPKALIEVKGEVLIERQIRQLQSAGIPEIYIITGYMAEQFEYLREKFGVHILYNQDHLTRNNHSSIYAAKDVIKNTYICSSDNYFAENPFERQVSESYYSALYAEGSTNEWCMQAGDDGYISHVTVGGENAWYMLGHAFWDEDFSKKFLKILEGSYHDPAIRGMFWEDIFIRNLKDLKMRIRKYSSDVIFEFDSLDELREFDDSYIGDTRSQILKWIAAGLRGTEAEISQIKAVRSTALTADGIAFCFRGRTYEYAYSDRTIKEAP